MLLLLLLMPPERIPTPPPDPVEEARRESLTRFGLGIWRERLDLPVQAVKLQEEAAKANPDSVEPLRELVKLYIDLGRDAAAMRVAKQVLERDATDTRTASEYGKLLVRSRRYGEASQVFKKAADQLPESQAYRKLGFLKDAARAAELAMDWPTASEWSEQALKLVREQRQQLSKPSAFKEETEVLAAEAQLLELLGDRSLSQKKYAEATTAYTEASKLWAGSLKQPVQAARLQWNLSGVLLGQEQFEEAYAATARFVSLGPSGLEPYQRFVLLLRKTHRSDEIIGTLAQLQLKYPLVEAISWVMAAETFALNPVTGQTEFKRLLKPNTPPKYTSLMVQAYTQNNRLDLLLNWLQEVNVILTPVREAKSEKPLALLPNQKQAAQVLQQLNAAIKANPATAIALLDRGFNANLNEETLNLLQEVAYLNNRPEQALELARQAFLQDPKKNFRNYYQQLYSARQWRECLEACDRAEGPRANPGMFRGGNPYYNYYRAAPLAELGRVNEAFQVCDNVSRGMNQGEENNFFKQQRRMDVMRILGRADEAIAVGLEILPTAHRYTGGVRDVRISLAQAYNDTKQFQAAEKLLREQLEQDPDDVLFLNNLGYNLADQGRKLPEAEAMIRRAIELDRDERARRGARELESGMYLDSLGWVLFRQGKFKEAREVMEKAVKYPDANWDGVLWDHLGDVAFRDGDTSRAREAWKKASKLYENSHVGTQQNRRAEVLRKLDQTK